MIAYDESYESALIDRRYNPPSFFFTTLYIERGDFDKIIYAIL